MWKWTFKSGCIKDGGREPLGYGCPQVDLIVEWVNEWMNTLWAVDKTMHLPHYPYLKLTRENTVVEVQRPNRFTDWYTVYISI